MSSSFIPSIRSLEEVEDYVSALTQEGLDELQIKDKLNKLDISEEWVNKGLILANSIEAQQQVLSIYKDKGFTQFLVGSTISLLGFFIFFYVYWQYNGSYIICFGAILYGYFMARKGYKAYKNPQLPTINSIRDKRKSRFKKF